jgi:pyruvate kinase
MNLARFNFSHGDHAFHAESIALVRKAAELEKHPIALVLDTSGPEIRTGVIRNNGNLLLKEGEAWNVISQADSVKLYGEDGAFSEQGRITVSYEDLADDIKVGAKILIADGLMGLTVESVEDRIMHCRVIDGGEVGSRKNVNIIGVHTRLPAMTEKDKTDLLFGHEQGMDYVAASFIRKSQDVITIQKYLSEIGSDMLVISKIEDEEGLNNVEEIVRVSEGIMVARGDLGVQIPPEQVPLMQKRIIRICNNLGKPVITATQMLDSMISNPRPTRAEASDVANAILDGTDCVMLSGETANGSHPELSVEVMDHIARTVEASEAYEHSLERHRQTMSDNDDLGRVVANAASRAADKIGAACIVVPTLSGRTAQLISQYRPRRPIVAASPSEKYRRRMLLYWGVVPVEANKEEDSEAMIQSAINAAIREGFAHISDKVISLTGLPVQSPFTTNNMRIHVIGNILARGERGMGGHCTGRVLKSKNARTAAMIFAKGENEILLTHTLDASFVPIIPMIKGIILEGMSELPREELLRLNPNIVGIAQVPNAMEKIEDHITVTLEGGEFIIYEGNL